MSERFTGITNIKDFVKKKGPAVGAAALLVSGCSSGTQEKPDTSVVFNITGECAPGKKGRADLFNFPYDKAGGDDFYIRAGKDGAAAKVSVGSHSIEVEGVPPASTSEKHTIELHGAQDERAIFELRATKKGVQAAVICKYA